MQSSRLSVVPTIPFPLPLSGLFKVHSLSPACQHPSHSLFNDCSISCLSNMSVHPPSPPHLILSLPLFSLHLSLFSSLPQGSALRGSCRSLLAIPPPPSAVSDHTVHMAFFFYLISHVPACLPAVGATESRSALLLQSSPPPHYFSFLLSSSPLASTLPAALQ